MGGTGQTRAKNIRSGVRDGGLGGGDGRRVLGGGRWKIVYMTDSNLNELTINLRVFDYKSPDYHF
jgi:hypothetical protein